MVGSRCVLASRSYLKDLIIPYHNQREVFKKSCRKNDLLSSTHHVNFCSIKPGYEWKDAVLLVTGGSRGIGPHIIKFALEEGVKKVANLDIDEDGGMELKKELKKIYGEDKVTYLNCDVSDEKQLTRNFESILNDKGNAYVVVNNVSGLDVSSVGPLITGSLTALDLMRKDRDGKGGAIINVSTKAALCPLPITPTCNADRHKVFTFSANLGNKEFYSTTGIRVMTICLGATDAAQIESDDYAKKTDNAFIMSLSNIQDQKAESAALAVIDMYKQGKCGSTWLSNSDNPEDITTDVKRAYSYLTKTTYA